MFQYLPHVFEQRAWTDDEKQALKDAIQQIVQVWPTHPEQTLTEALGSPCHFTT